MHFAFKPLFLLSDKNVPELLANLKYRVSALKGIIAQLGDKLQELQWELPEDDPKAKEIEELLEKMAKATIELTK